MRSPSEQTPRGGLGRLVAATAAFSLVAPAALVALPLAALIAVSRPTSRAEWLTVGVAGSIAVWWLLVPGELPDQTVRAAAVIATAVFVISTVRTRWPVIHRLLAAAVAAAAGVTALFALVGSSWGALRWSVAHRLGLTARTVIGQMWSSAGGAEGPPRALAEFESWLGSMVELVAQHFPALTLFQLMAGLALATTIAFRVGRRPIGVPLRRFREFRFTEHLGWAAVLPLIVLLVPKLAAAKTAAANVLVVAGGLYALRGVAVAAFGVALTGIGGAGVAVGAALLVLLMLPVAAAGAILLGVLDSGLDLRRRWSRPPASE